MADGLWVTSDPTPDGVYRTTITLDEDFAKVLTPTEAVAWAMAWIDAGTRALYDAAVYAQLKDLGIKHDYISETILDLRESRKPKDDEAVAPMRLEPGVNSKGEPFVGFYLNNEQRGQLTAHATVNHGRHVLEVVTAADYDAAYLRMLKGMIGLDDDTARSVVGGLRDQMVDLLEKEGV